MQVDMREPVPTPLVPTAEAGGPEMRGAVRLGWAGRPAVALRAEGAGKGRTEGESLPVDADFSTDVQESLEEPSPRMLQLPDPVPHQRSVFLPLSTESGASEKPHPIPANAGKGRQPRMTYE